MRPENLKLLKECLKEQLKSDNPAYADMKPVFTQLLNGQLKGMDITDSFKFNNNNCLEKCDGHCCMNLSTMIRMAPADFEAMMRSPFIKHLGFTREQVGSYFLQIMLGGESLIPFAIIRMFSFGGRTMCPFVMHMIKLQEMRFGKPMLKVNGVCALGQENKPVICLLYPLGRAIMSGLNDDTLYFQVSDCPATKTGINVPIKSFVSEYENRDKEKDLYFNKMNNLVQLLKKKHSKAECEKIMEKTIPMVFFDEGSLTEKLQKIEAYLKPFF
jgi:hypothetical protein